MPSSSLSSASLHRGTGYLSTFLELLGSLSEQNLEMALGVGGSFRPELEGQIHAASFQCGVAGVVAQGLLVDQIDLVAAPAVRCDLIQHPGIPPPGFPVAWSQAQVLPECFRGFGPFALLLGLSRTIEQGRRIPLNLTAVDEVCRSAQHEHRHDHTEQENQI